MNLSILPSADLWRRLNPLSSEYDRDARRRAAIVAELRTRHLHLRDTKGAHVHGPHFHGNSMPYPWELHL